MILPTYFSIIILDKASIIFLTFLVAQSIAIATTKTKTTIWAINILWFFVVLHILGLLQIIISTLKNTKFSFLSAEIDLFSILYGAIVILFIVLLSKKTINKIISIIHDRLDIDASLKLLFEKAITIILWIFVGLLIVNILGLDLSVFAYFSGALGIGIGLGFQKIVSNILSGVTLLLDRSLKIGDVLEIDNGEGVLTYGIVKHIGVRCTCIETRSGIETLIPNELLISNPVINWSYSNKKVRRIIPVGVSYNCDIELARQLCLEAAKDNPRVLNDPQPVCHIVGFGDSSVNLELRVWITDPEKGLLNLSSDIYLLIWKKFKANNIEIPFPQRDIHIKSNPFA